MALERLEHHDDLQVSRLASRIVRGLDRVNALCALEMSRATMGFATEFCLDAALSDITRLATNFESRVPRVTYQIEGPSRVRLPETIVFRLIFNLVHNAVTAAAKPGGEVRIAAVRNDEELRILIADNGPGLPPSVDRYLRRRSPIIEDASQVGLGLKIVVQSVQQIYGRLFVVSTGAIGTIIEIVVPIPDASRAPSTAPYCRNTSYIAARLEPRSQAVTSDSVQSSEQETAEFCKLIPYL
jgi:signal transduction histidine kinase